MILVKETEKFLDDHVTNHKDDPFFTYFALGAVHIPHSPPDYYLDGTPVAGQYPNEHLSMLDEMDKVVGSLVKALDDRQLLEDTIIIFTSDNGGLGNKYSNSLDYGHLSNGPLRGIKGEVYEGGHRIPMTIRWDNGVIPKGAKRSNLVGLNDLFATLSDLAGIETPIGQAIDSISFADNIYNQSAETRESIGVWTYWGKDQIGYEAIRKNEMKLMRRFGTSSLVLYNLTADISESIDIAVSNQELVMEMVSDLEAISPCYDNPEKFIIARNGSNVTRKSCQWFQRKKYRCLKYEAGRTQCRKACVTKSNRKYCNR